MSHSHRRPSRRVEDAKKKVQVPAILMLVVGALGLLVGGYWVFNGIVVLQMTDAQLDKIIQAQKDMNPDQAQAFDAMKQQGFTPKEAFRAIGKGYLISGLVSVLACLLVIFGGIRMLSLKGYGMGVFASIIVAIPLISPCSCCGLGTIVGIWSLVVLMNGDVKEAFQAEAQPPRYREEEERYPDEDDRYEDDYPEDDRDRY